MLRYARWDKITTAIFTSLFIGRLFFVPQAALASKLTRSEIKPPDVYVLVQTLLNEIHILRHYMGKPKNTLPELAVYDASPREVYFQALALFKRTERLCFEHTSRHGQPPTQLGESLLPGDVFLVVKSSLERIRRIKIHYQILKAPVVPQRDSSRSPTNVFRALVQAQRQLNLMVEQQIAPEDVYQQITSSIAYTKQIIAEFASSEVGPSMPQMQLNKTPKDVYLQLLKIFGKISTLHRTLDFQSLRLEQHSEQNILPSDVFILASLIGSETRFLHSKIVKNQILNRLVYPGRKFPSQVLQQAKYLELQLLRLETLNQSRPKVLAQRIQAGQKASRNTPSSSKSLRE